MFRVPRVRKNFGRILRGTNAFALGFVHGPVRATAELYRDRIQRKCLCYMSNWPKSKH